MQETKTHLDSTFSRRAVLGGLAGLALSACGGGGEDETLLSSGSDKTATIAAAAPTKFDACSSATSVNTAQFGIKFDQYYSHVMGAVGKDGTVFKKLTYPGENVAACIDPNLYAGNDGSGGHTNTAKSEGQGYGMVLAVAANDKVKFAQLWNFTDKHMRSSIKGQEGYFDWLNTPYDGAKHVGTGIAPDGEIWIATGLLMAWKRWNDNGFRDAGFAILDALKSHWTQTFKGGVVRSWYSAEHTNPSYVNPAFFAYWDKVRPRNGWDKIIAANRNFLVAATGVNGGLAYDWTKFDGTVVSTSTGLPRVHGYDAYRVAMNQALDTVWNGSTAHKSRAQDAINTLNKAIPNNAALAMYALYAKTGVGECNSKVTGYTYSLLNNPLIGNYYEGLLSTIACGILSGKLRNF